jgi:hypothetical protein
MQKLNFASTIWRQSCGDLNLFIYYNNEKVFYNFYYYTIDWNVQMNDVVFSI